VSASPLSTRRVLRIALAFQTAQPHLERITRGILQFAEQSGGWQIALNPDGAAVTLESLENWEGDGVLAMVETESQMEAARRLRVPVINLSARLGPGALPGVVSDNRAIGRLAAEHLLERGFRKCAFYGLEQVVYSEDRLQGFRERVEAAGGEVRVHLTHSFVDTVRPWDWDRESLERWLSSLQGRVGVMAVHDYRAQLLLGAARRMGISVPGQMAVIGVNDDPVACTGSVPTLSSVPQDGYRIGLAAAEGIARWILEGRVPQGMTEIPPLRVSARQSSAMFGVEEPRLLAAMDYIEAHLGRSFGVEEVARQVAVSRRWLESLFLKHLNCSPHAYIVRRRVLAAKLHLETFPATRPSELARRCGFPDTRSLKAALGTG
jgi:LacI family transcriptional regulator